MTDIETLIELARRMPDDDVIDALRENKAQWKYISRECVVSAEENGDVVDAIYHAEEIGDRDKQIDDLEAELIITEGDASRLHDAICEGRRQDAIDILNEVTGENYRSVREQLMTEDFVAALTRASAIRAIQVEAGSFINTRMCVRESEIEFKTVNQEGEEGSDFCEIERASGADVDIAFKGEWLLAAVKSIDLPRVEILYGDIGDPIMIRPYKGEFENVRLVMPRRF